MSALNDYVTETDVKNAIEKLCGSQSQVLNYQVSPTNVQGFSSLILRVTANVTKPEGLNERVTLIAKRLPLAQSQLEIMTECDFFEREVLFFKNARPLLRLENLPIVRCLTAKSGLIMMEDLSAKGFRVLANDMSDMSQNVLQYPHLKMIMENLARFHAASLDIDWLQVLPYLKYDAFLEVQCPFINMFTRACSAYADVLNEFFPEVDKKYSTWLKSSKPLEMLIKLVKPRSDDELVVLSHGDFWVNNIMFKEDSDTRLPLDIVFVDFQMCRYVPPSRDIMNVLYTCCNKQIRDDYEDSLLQTFVSSFNEALGYEKLKLEDFLKEYNSSRLFGLSVAVVFRSMNLMPELYPKQGEEMSSEMFDAMFSGSQFDDLLQKCNRNPVLSDLVKEILLQLIDVLDSLNIC